MPTRQLQFGDYVFENTFHVADDGLVWSVPHAKMPRADGARLLTQTLQPKRVLVRGGFIDGPFDTTVVLRDKLDALRLALNTTPARLYLYDDRYYRCVQVEEFRNPYDPTHFDRMAVGCEIVFLACDPAQYETTNRSDTWSAPASGGTKSVTAGGNFYAKPTITVNVGGTGSQAISFTVSNLTTDEAFTLIGTVTGGQAIVVDCLLEQVLIGTTDKMSLFDGQFPRLAVGANTFQLTTASGSVASIGFAWNNRYC